MTPTQVKILKHVFSVSKSPGMPECANLAHSIGLQKRVVQVWFQNARCKDKKARQHYLETKGREAETHDNDLRCGHCPDQRQLSSRAELLDHVLTPGHLDNVRASIERGQYDPPTPGVIPSGRNDSLK